MNASNADTEHGATASDEALPPPRVNLELLARRRSDFVFFGLTELSDCRPVSVAARNLSTNESAPRDSIHKSCILICKFCINYLWHVVFGTYLIQYEELSMMRSPTLLHFASINGRFKLTPGLCIGLNLNGLSTGPSDSFHLLLRR